MSDSMVSVGYGPGWIQGGRLRGMHNGVANPKLRGGSNTFIGLSSGAPRIWQRGATTDGLGAKPLVAGV